MGSGFFSGVLWGVVIAGLGLGVVSLITPFPGPAIPPVSQMEEPTSPAKDADIVVPPPQKTEIAPDPQIADTIIPSETVSAPDMVPSATQAEEMVSVEEETSAEDPPLPMSSDPAEPMEQPAEEEDTAMTAETDVSEEPVAESPPAEPAMSEPVGMAAGGEPMEEPPLVPEVGNDAQTEAVAQDGLDPGPEEGARVEGELPFAAAEPQASDALPDTPPEAPQLPEISDMLETPPPDMDEAPVAPAEEIPAPELSRDDPPALPETTTEDPDPEIAEAPPLPPLTAEEQALVETAEALPEAVDDASSPDAGMSGSAPVILQPQSEPLPSVPPLSGEVEGVTADRLPRIGNVPPEPVEAGAATEAAKEDANQPAHIRYAREFENPAAKPVFAILLLDTGGAELDRERLAALPFPVTFAIDPTASDATSAERIYRQAGQEVVMLATGLPPEATPMDLEVAFETHAQVLQEAVAVLIPQAGEVQQERQLAQQMLAVLKEQGRGVLSWDQGLNPVEQIARREGLPNMTVFRALDGDGESVETISRYLDRAAFKAAQDGRVVVVGAIRPETVDALLEWVAGDHAASVALAPVTAAMEGR
ncbi:MAG: divergent polysaccharide deacetylase family protein [Pseudorhodobacter sp.]